VILSIVDPAELALKAFVLERDAAGLVAGAEATVAIDARPGTTFAGRVASVAELSRPIEQGSPVKYFEARVEITDDTRSLSPGMKGEARIVTARLENAVVVPRSAVHEEGETRFVLVSDGSKVERRTVRLGVGDLVRVAVEEGLAEGERVVLGMATEADRPPTVARGGPTPGGRGGGRGGGGSRRRG
jgi:multidrug efflux pump subunit AcrA (membrane-fusion protein)